MSTDEKFDEKEAAARKIIEAIRSAPDKAMIEIVILSYTQGLEAGANLAHIKGSAVTLPSVK